MSIPFSLLILEAVEALGWKRAQSHLHYTEELEEAQDSVRQVEFSGSSHCCQRDRALQAHAERGRCWVLSTIRASRSLLLLHRNPGGYTSVTVTSWPTYLAVFRRSPICLLPNVVSPNMLLFKLGYNR